MNKNLILGFILLVGLIWILFWGASYIPKDWIPFFCAGFGFVLSRFYEAWKDNKNRLYEKKREIYLELIEPFKNKLIELTLNENSNTPATTSLTDDERKEMIKTAFDVILYGSDDVIKNYGKFRIASINSTDVLSEFSQLLKSIRKDVGNSYSNLTQAEILIMFTNLTPEEINKYNK